MVGAQKLLGDERKEEGKEGVGEGEERTEMKKCGTQSRNVEGRNV